MRTARVPGDDEIRALHQRHAPGPDALELVYTHCEIVWRVAEQLLTRNDRETGALAGIDRDLVRAGCLLHDVGVYRLVDGAGQLEHAGYLRHGLLGHELLAEAGYSEAICRFASRHTGVGITRDDVIRQGLPLPPADYVAETPEEELVMYADKFHTKAAPPSFLTAETYSSQLGRFGADKVAAFKEMRGRFGEPDLGSLSVAYGQPVRLYAWPGPPTAPGAHALGQLCSEWPSDWVYLPPPPRILAVISVLGAIFLLLASEVDQRG